MVQEIGGYDLWKNPPWIFLVLLNYVKFLDELSYPIYYTDLGCGWIYSYVEVGLFMWKIKSNQIKKSNQIDLKYDNLFGLILNFKNK